ncbi:MAG: hypothetical protein PSX80_03455 [bacterium]|nr:hypothetical protein [bacterium]
MSITVEARIGSLCCHVESISVSAEDIVCVSGRPEAQDQWVRGKYKVIEVLNLLVFT